MARYEDYLSIQLGGGAPIYDGGVGRIYIGAPYQRGHGGIGSFLAGIFRRVLPIFSRGAKAVGKEGMRAAMNIMSDVTTQNTPIRESFRTRLRESGDNLKRKAEEKLDKLMEGSGYKIPRFEDTAQSRIFAPVVGRKRKKTSGKRLKKKKKKNSAKKKKTRKTANRSIAKKKTKRSVRDIFDN